MELAKVVFIVSSVVIHAVLSVGQLTTEWPGPINQPPETVMSNDLHISETKRVMFVLRQFLLLSVGFSLK